MFRNAIGLLLVGSTVLGACDLFPNLHLSRTDDTERLQQLKDQIEKEIGIPSASELAQCKTIAFGSKPCGGPWTYLVYSTARTDEDRLKELVREYNALDEKINREKGLGSTCDTVMDPGAVLEGGVCKVKRN